jgi:ankyrin repeat protein
VLVNHASDFSELNVDTADKQGRTALHIAAQGNYLEGAKKLLAEGASSSFPYLLFTFNHASQNFQNFLKNLA